MVLMSRMMVITSHMLVRMITLFDTLIFFIFLFKLNIYIYIYNWRVPKSRWIALPSHMMATTSYLMITIE